MKRMLISALLLAVATPTMVHAQAASAIDIADMSCLLVAADEDPDATKEEAESMTILAIYFVGKLFGRNPSFNIDTFVRANAEALDKPKRDAELLRCSDELGKRGEAMIAAGSSLQGK